MNAPVNVIETIMEIGSTDCKYSIAQPTFHTNIDPNGSEGEPLNVGREIKAIDMLVASFPEKLRRILKETQTIRSMTLEEMPSFAKLGGQTLLAAAKQFETPGAAEDLDILNLIRLSSLSNKSNSVK